MNEAVEEGERHRGEPRRVGRTWSSHRTSKWTLQVQLLRQEVLGGSVEPRSAPREKPEEPRGTSGRRPALSQPFDRFRSGKLIIRIWLPNASVREEIFIATSLRARSAFCPPSEGRPESPGTGLPESSATTSGCPAPYPGAPEHSSGGRQGVPPTGGQAEGRPA